jgi:hypothetical protein
VELEGLVPLWPTGCGTGDVDTTHNASLTVCGSQGQHTPNGKMRTNGKALGTSACAVHLPVAAFRVLCCALLIWLHRSGSVPTIIRSCSCCCLNVSRPLRSQWAGG